MQQRSLKCTSRRLAALRTSLEKQSSFIRGYHTDSHGHREPFFFVLFPEHEGREKAVRRMTNWWLGDPTARYMKVVDTESGRFRDASQALQNEVLGFSWEEPNAPLLTRTTRSDHQRSKMVRL
jgi:hypothetical protein